MPEKMPSSIAFYAGHTQIMPHRLYSWKRRYVSLYGLLYVCAGNGVIRAEDETLSAGAGDLILLFPGIRHEFLPDSKLGWDLYWFHFPPGPEPEKEAALDWEEVIPGAGRIKLPGNDWVEPLLREAYLLEFERPTGWFPTVRNLLAGVLHYGRALQTRGSSAIDERMDLARKMLRKEDSQLTMEEVAQKCGMSRAAFFARFREATGYSPRRYRELLQLRRAQLLLECGSLPISEIAGKIGMGDGFYFSTRFKQTFGLTPRQYRKEGIK